MSEIYKKKEVIVTEEVITGYRCDICGTEVDTNGDLPESWHAMSHKHEGWGNDSSDSLEHFHVCSADCYIARLHKSVALMDKHYALDKSVINSYSLVFIKELLGKLKKLEN